MAERIAFKDNVSSASVAALAKELSACDSTFPRKRFERSARRGLDGLELKARIEHVARALSTCLPDFASAAGTLDALADRLSRAGAQPSMWVYWPVCTYVERHGLAHPDLALATMKRLTRFSSCEFAIRPYLEADLEGVIAELRSWCDDDDVHVRRLVSEGTRPRLPWGRQLKALIVDPSPCIPLLDALHDDAELYVRRSVANHLNDIAKDHPDLAVSIAGRWSRASKRAEVQWVVRHALRTLAKRGHPGALALQGFGKARCAEVELTLSHRRLRLGGTLTIAASFRSRAKQQLMVDYAIHHRKANGGTSPKVFKWKRLDVGAGEAVSLTKNHRFEPISTRRYYPGTHKIDLLVNGAVLASTEFQLVGATAEAQQP